MAGRRCSTCQHERRLEIEAEMLQGKPLHAIERKWNISDESLAYHRDKCIPDLLAKGREESEAFTIQTIIERLEFVQRATAEIFERAKGQDDFLALKAIQRIESQLAVAVNVRKLIEARQGNKNDVVAILNEARERHKRMTAELSAPVDASAMPDETVKP